MTDTAVHPYASDAPVFTIEQQTEGALARDLRRLDIEEGCLGLRTLVAHFHAVGPDTDGAAEELSYLDGDTLDLGQKIEVALGPPGGERMLFGGLISAIEVTFAEGATPYVSISAEDALMKLRFQERTATYTDMTDAQIVEEIATANGMSAQADADGPTYGLVQQWEQSDLAFIRDRAVRLNAEVWVDGDDVIHFSDRAKRDGAEIQLVQGDELIGLSARVDLAHQRTTVSYRGWDNLAVEAIAEEATVDVVAAEVASGRLGPDVVGEVFERPALSRARQDVLTTETAQAYADAEMRRRARSFVSVEGVTSGTPDLVPGAKLNLRRVSKPFEGDGYRATWAHHSYDLSSGYRTRFRAERPGVVT